MSDFDLILDDENELKFAVTIEGAEQGSPTARLHISTNKGYDLVFEGERSSDGELSVVVPPLKGVIAEGSYSAELEVIIDERVFKPLTMTTNFKRAIKVEAAVKTIIQSRQPSVSASLLTEEPREVSSVKKKVEKKPVKKSASLDDILKELSK